MDQYYLSPGIVTIIYTLNGIAAYRLVGNAATDHRYSVWRPEKGSQDWSARCLILKKC